MCANMFSAALQACMHSVLLDESTASYQPVNLQWRATARNTRHKTKGMNWEPHPYSKSQCVVRTGSSNKEHTQHGVRLDATKTARQCAMLADTTQQRRAAHSCCKSTQQRSSFLITSLARPQLANTEGC